MEMVLQREKNKINPQFIPHSLSSHFHSATSFTLMQQRPAFWRAQFQIALYILEGKSTSIKQLKLKLTFLSVEPSIAIKSPFVSITSRAEITEMNTNTDNTI